MGIRNIVTVDVLDLKKILLSGLVVFTLVGSIGLVLPENLAFAQGNGNGNADQQIADNLVASTSSHNNRNGNGNGNDDDDDDDNDNANQKIADNLADILLLKVIADTLNALISDMDGYIMALADRLTGVEDDVDALQADVEALKGSTISPVLQVVAEPYTNTVTETIASNTVGSISASCEQGDSAISGESKLISPNNSKFLRIFTTGLSGSDSYKLDAYCDFPGQSCEIEVSVTCQ